MKLLSIVISSYNAAAYLHYCVESLVIGWDQVGNFSKGQYIMMHSLIYRTDLLRASQF
ncbi:family 2 glycosyl transferase [Streptococcus pneumoniae]|nr:family 2 glycosyl transferase [Streptococcus pneumoniae]